MTTPWRPADRDAYWAAIEAPGGRLWYGESFRSPDDVAVRLEMLTDWSSGNHASWCVSASDGGP